MFNFTYNGEGLELLLSFTAIQGSIRDFPSLSVLGGDVLPGSK